MSDSKLHHFVPRFLLRRFSVDPTVGNPLLWRLDKTSGACSRRSVQTECVVSGFNELREAKRLPKLYVEQALSSVEDQATKAVADLVERRWLHRDRREAMALFLHLQHNRTPRGRQWAAYTLEKGYKLSLMSALLDPEQVRQMHRLQGEDITLEDAERLGREWYEELDSGALELKSGHDMAVASMFMSAPESIPAIAWQTTWTVLHAPAGADFVVSDHPILRHNPNTGPQFGVGWLSPGSVASMALDPRSALRIEPGPPELHHVETDRAAVEDINLRTYASAEWAIYGPSLAIVQGVREKAKRHKQRVGGFTPVAPAIHIVEQQGEDDLKEVQRLRPGGKVKRRQEWPRWGDEDGLPRRGISPSA